MMDNMGMNQCTFSNWHMLEEGAYKVEHKLPNMHSHMHSTHVQTGKSIQFAIRAMLKPRDVIPSMPFLLPFEILAVLTVVERILYNKDVQPEQYE